ncbi:transglutaminase-like cysteine peptidase [Sphingomonas montanisoli]|uniref:Transglutaminase-like cysteine peptidase n=1 Tax=Sphingomonas montanisoli TaxID=2606412 RepID=A0A5D9C269_9SPHN|nr:transglutaminase-like cysteine peptidase [Sphingomonas montanisoli]TZG25110.1 transglutaminase-like cysteine peptidase [Sphingomonas montanisoli]
MARSIWAVGGTVVAIMIAGVPGAAQRPTLKTDHALRDGGVSMPPGGWIDYCAHTASDPACRAARKPDLRPGDVIPLDEARWNQIEQIHAELTKIEQTDEKRMDDHWVVARTSGDCEDIALAGREKLIAAGFPRRAVRLTTALTEDGDRHVVVTVDGIRDATLDTWVLDNRSTRVTSWRKLEDSGYRFLTRQAPSGPYWVSLKGPDGKRLS